jgi:cystathionine gamma-synthase
MAAVAAVLSLVPQGGLVVAPTAAYNGVLATLAERESTGEVRVRRVNLTDTAAVLAALDGADLLWLESPSNPLLDVADLPTLIEAARAAGVLRKWPARPTRPTAGHTLAHGPRPRPGPGPPSARRAGRTPARRP